MSFSQQFIDEIKDRNPIEEVISRYLPLKRAGSNLVGICPFHNEKTPSFTVFPATKSYYCFGCGAGGDIFSFIMQTEGLDYRSAVEALATRAGIPLEDDPGYTKPERPTVSRQRTVEAMKAAGRFFYACLNSDIGAPAREYLDKRKITPVTIKRFGIGYAPDSWDKLFNHLKANGFTETETRAAFLTGMGKNGRPFDIFRNRIMFPVFDINGDCVAFSGRRLNDGQDDRKYVNTSDTPAFKKSKVLFGMNIAKQQNDGTLIMCEGAVDAIALQQAGFTNAVATLGTAITSEHARIISRFVKTVFLAYDIDKAGRNATEKAIRLLSEVGVATKIIDLGNEVKDPDEFIKRFGAEAFRKKLKSSSGQVDYVIDQILSGHDLDIPDDKLRAAGELYDFVSDIWNKTEREIYSMRVAQKLGLPSKLVSDEVEIRSRRKEKQTKNTVIKNELREEEGFGDKVNRDKIRFSTAAMYEERLLGILMNRPDIASDIVKDISPELFATDFNKKIFLLFQSDFEDGRDITISKDNSLTAEEAGAVSRIIAKRAKAPGNTVEEATALISALQKEYLKRSTDEQINTDPVNGLNDYINTLRKNKSVSEG